MGRDNRKDSKKTHDDSLLSSPHIYSVIVKNVPIGFTLVDKNGIVVDFNTAAENLTGYSKEEILGKSHFEIIHGSKKSESCPLFTEVFKQKVPSIASETVLKKKNGETITLLVMAFPLFDDSGNFIGGAELFRDISEMKKMERERKNLLATFAHDMKNPVVGAGGFLARLLSGKAGPLTEKQKDYLEVVMQAVTKLQQLISDFLEFSRLERKEYKPFFRQYHLVEAIQRQVELSRLTAKKKGIKLFFEFNKEDVSVVDADEEMIDRVIANLIDNAVKYNRSGGEVTVRFASRDKDVLVEVQDTGVGFYEEDLPCVFDAFCRLNRDVEGSGLGLSIAKAIIEVHQGTMSVESAPGSGSRFWFTLPKKQTSK